MKAVTLFSFLTLLSATATQALAEPVNANCPVGKEAIVESAGTVMHGEHEIGICCPGCGKQFLKWDDARKDKFVVQAIAHKKSGTAHQTMDETASDAPASPYPLGTCALSGRDLDVKGTPTTKVFDGREVRFCCSGCSAMFETDKAGYWKKVDQQIIKDQLPFYPTDTCVVSGEPLTEDGEDTAINIVYNNRLVRLCCKMCKSQFKDDSVAFIGKLDKAVADAQRKDYPLDTCVVAGSKLGSMGEPTEMIAAGRLVRFCCGGCSPKVESDPTKYTAKIDAAWRAKGMFMPIDEVKEHTGDHSGHEH